MISDENYITVQGWMVNELGLTGNELLCYALINGFCQDGNSVFSGSSKYLCEWLNLTKPAVFSILKRLHEKGLIDKIEKNINGVRAVDYKTLPVVKKLYHPGKETLPPGKETLPHNIVDNIEDNNKKEIYKESFEKFWNEFPKERIGNKEKAYSAWKRAIKEKRTTEEEIIQAAKQYANSDEVKRGYAKGCQAWINDYRFKVQYAKEENEKEEKNIKIAIGTFYLDNSMKEYADVTVGMSDNQCEKLWKWIYEKYLGQELSQNFIREIIRRYNKNNLQEKTS